MNTPVNFEIAQLLKEKGYNNPCYHYYYNNKLDSSSKDNWNDLNGYSAPTIAEVVMWLYEKHEIWINVTMENNEEDIISFGCGIFRNENNEACFKQRLSDFSSPTEAYKAAIEYTIKNLIQ